MSDKFTIDDALVLMWSNGWSTKTDSSSDRVHTLQSKTGDEIILVGRRDSPMSDEAAERIKDRADASDDATTQERTPDQDEAHDDATAQNPSRQPG